MSLPDLNDWPSGYTVPSGGHLEQAVNAIRYLYDTDARTDRRSNWRLAEVWPGIITNAGPASEADWTNERYWVKRQYIAGGYSQASIVLNNDIQTDGTVNSAGSPGKGPYIFVATNLAEWVPGNSGSHHLRTDGTQAVIVMAFFDRGADQTRVRYLFSFGGVGGCVPIGLTSRDTSHGKFGWMLGFVVPNPGLSLALNPTADATEAMLYGAGIGAFGDSVYVVSSAEIQTGNYWFDFENYDNWVSHVVLGYLIGKTTTDGKPVYLTTEISTTICTPPT